MKRASQGQSYNGRSRFANSKRGRGGGGGIGNVEAGVTGDRLGCKGALTNTNSRYCVFCSAIMKNQTTFKQCKLKLFKIIRMY